MKTISSKSTFKEVQFAARMLGLDVCEANIGYELWQDDDYKGGFTSLDGVVAQINLRLGIAAAEASEDAESLQKRLKEQRENVETQQVISNKIAAMLAEATEAALIHNEQIIGYCKTNIKNGGYVNIASTITSEGAPVNCIQVKVSRSEKNLKKTQGLVSYIPKLFSGEIFYVK